MDDGEVIAVKKLNATVTFDDQQFMQEFENLIRVRHQNIIRLVGYCYETKHKYIEVNGAYKLASIAGRALCFEYLQHGSLDKHLSGNKLTSMDLFYFSSVNLICNNFNISNIY